jgi:ABC-2 type transport system permease protein
MTFLELFFREVKYFTNFNNKMYQFLLFFQPLIYSMIVYFLSQVRENINTGLFVVASAIISMWSYVLYSSGSALVSQKWNDTLKLIIGSPVSLFQVIVTKTISNSFIAILSMILSFLYGTFIFRFKIIISDYLLFCLSLLTFIFSLSVMGIILAIVFITSQNVYDYQNFIQIPLILLCGVFIPVESFPIALQSLSYLFPMTWGIKSIYGSLNISQDILSTIMISISVSTLYLLIGYFVIKKMEMVLRRDGKWGAI